MLFCVVVVVFILFYFITIDPESPTIFKHFLSIAKPFLGGNYCDFPPIDAVD